MFAPNLKLESMQALGIEVCVAGQPLHIYSIYKPPQEKLILSEVHKIMSSTVPTIAASDWNCKHPAWNSMSANTQGRRLFDDAESRGYSSGPEAPTRYPAVQHQMPDVLDICFHRGPHCEPYQEVLLDELTSDHLPVLLVLDQRPTQTILAPPPPASSWHPQPPAGGYHHCLTTSPSSWAKSAGSGSCGSATVTPLSKPKPTIKSELRDQQNQEWERRLDSAADDWTSIHRLCRQLSNAQPPVRLLTHSDGTLRYRAEDRAGIFAECLERQFQPNPVLRPDHTAEVDEFLLKMKADPLPPPDEGHLPIFFSPG
ncbi:putative endonuclease and reverse transcriptase-like protein [Operophtera brumata]|uniref:Putative endonuclease and reverse transcriptase-like protein n=1 Tax=Operophtera brumata TaxID=104452 RepID=A0A0L7LA58_OPEBR|nr:putative endonuclease and reverse transcriptase-like protein [Operophtera brumata]